MATVNAGPNRIGHLILLHWAPHRLPGRYPQHRWLPTGTHHGHSLLIRRHPTGLPLPTGHTSNQTGGPRHRQHHQRTPSTRNPGAPSTYQQDPALRPSTHWRATSDHQPSLEPPCQSLVCGPHSTGPPHWHHALEQAHPTPPTWIILAGAPCSQPTSTVPPRTCSTISPSAQPSQ